MAAIEQITTAKVPQNRRLGYWNEVAEDTFTGLRIDSDQDSFYAEMARWRLGEMTVIRPRSTAAKAYRRASAASHDTLQLCFQHHGSSLIRQKRKECLIEAGQFVLIDGEDYYDGQFSAPYELIVAQFPRDCLAARVPDLDAKLTSTIPDGTVANRLLRDYLLSMWRNGETAGNLEEQASATDLFFNIVTLALNQSQAHGGRERTLAENIEILIEESLADPNLGVSMLADQLNLSTRSLQRLFSVKGFGPSAYILDRRLEKAAARLLAEPETDITQIAHEGGFNDANYFTRCFRRKYGVPPSLYRKHQ